MRRRNLIHPGEILLEEFLKPMNISQNRLAASPRRGSTQSSTAGVRFRPTRPSASGSISRSNRSFG